MTVPITLLPANTTMPEGLCIVHKQSRSYCIETDTICSLREFNKKMKILRDSLVEMNQTEFIRMNTEYWAGVAALPSVEPRGPFLFYDNR